MMILDTLFAVGIVAGAAAYLYCKFAKTRKSGGCGCSSGGVCCGSQSRAVDTHCCTPKH
jgi:hypothetical protein